MKLTFIGGGNMAQAIIGGLVQKGFAASDITVVELIAEQRARLQQQLGVRAVASAAEAAPYGDIGDMDPQQTAVPRTSFPALSAGVVIAG